jgi:hypothetical protein
MSVQYVPAETIFRSYAKFVQLSGPLTTPEDRIDHLFDDQAVTKSHFSGSVQSKSSPSTFSRGAR